MLYTTVISLVIFCRVHVCGPCISYFREMLRLKSLWVYGRSNNKLLKCILKYLNHIWKTVGEILLIYLRSYFLKWYNLHILLSLQKNIFHPGLHPPMHSPVVLLHWFDTLHAIPQLNLQSFPYVPNGHSTSLIVWLKVNHFCLDWEYFTNITEVTKFSEVVYNLSLCMALTAIV